MTSHTNVAKRVWEETEAGKCEVKLKKLYADKKLEKKWNDTHQRWVDIHRAKSLSKQKDIIEEYEKDVEKLQDLFRKTFEEYMLGVTNTEIEYLEKVKNETI